MSHWAVKKLNIVNPDTEILREAVLRAAKELGVEVKFNDVVRGWRRAEKAFAVFQVRTAYGHGIGVTVGEDGRLTIMADVHSEQDVKIARKVEALVAKHYVALATKKALVRLGYAVKTEEREKEIVLVGVATGSGGTGRAARRGGVKW